MIDTHGSLSEKFLKKGFWLYFFGFIIAPMAYIIKIIISNELEVAEVGILYGIISLISILSAFNDLGVTESLKHFIPAFVNEKRYDKIKSILVYAFIIQTLTGALIASFFYFGAPLIATYYLKSEAAIEALKIFAFFFLGINIFQVIFAFFISIQNTLYSKLIEFLRAGVLLGSTLFILFLDLGNLTNYSYGWIVGLYTGIVFAVILMFTKYHKKYFQSEKILWDKKLLKEILKYAVLVFLGTQAATILGQIDMQMIIFLLGTLEAGYYTNYLTIIGIPFVIIGPIFAILIPVFSEMHSKKQHASIRTVKQIFTKNFMVIAIAMNILFFVFAETIAYILFGEKFIQSGVILQYSILFLVFNFLLQINFNILAGVGRVKERLHIILTAIVLNFFMNLILIKYIGVEGAALATGLGWVFIYVMSEKVLGKEFFIKFDYRFICKNLFSFVLIGVGMHLFISPIFGNIGRLQSLGYMCIIGVIYFAIFTIINLKEFKMFIGEIKKLRN